MGIRDSRGRFPPGVSGNPLGKPPLPERLREVPEFTVEEVKRIFAIYSRMSVEELEEVVKDKTIPMFDLNVARGLLVGATSGDYSKINFLLDRMIGKVKEVHQVDVKPVVSEMEFFTREQRVAEIQRLMALSDNLGND